MEDESGPLSRYCTRVVVSLNPLILNPALETTPGWLVVIQRASVKGWMSVFCPAKRDLPSNLVLAIWARLSAVRVPVEPCSASSFRRVTTVFTCTRELSARLSQPLAMEMLVSYWSMAERLSR